MYIGYLQDRKLLSYPALKDTSCGMKLVLITDSTVLLIRNLPLNVKGKSKRITVVICLEVLIIFGNAEPAEAKDNWVFPGAHGFKPPISRPNRNNPPLGGAKQNTGKGVSLSANKPPQAPSGFRTPQKPVKNQSFYGRATGFGGSSGSESLGDDLNPNTFHFNTKSSD